MAAAWVPIVELKFDETSGPTSSNTGSASGSATLSSSTPSRVSTIPISGGVRALDFGTTNGNFYADMTGAAVLAAVKNLKSLTITGWVNCAMDGTNYGGGRIVSWYQNSPAGGVDLAYRSGGQLGLGINQYNDDGGVTSSPGKISVDPGLSYNNWRFFAVTFDGTVTSDNVKFYFGTNNGLASLDQTVTYNRTAVGSITAPSLTIGNVPSHHRDGYFYAPFHGLIDQVRIYGSTTNNSGVLNLDQIQSLQQASTLVNVFGVVYEQWNGISGNSLNALTCDPRFPFNPSLTKLQTNFEKLSSGDDNYGARLSGWVKAPATGPYTFWIVGDDNAELRVSTDANPENKRLVASVPTYNSNDTNWGQFGSQRSEPMTLQANQYYYVEAVVKDGGGPDFVRVGWQLPNGTQERPIPQARVVTTPPDAVTFYPSAYPLYEPGTFAKKAEMGWQKESGNDHFYIQTDGTKALMAKNGTTIIPHRLFFGGKFPGEDNLNDLGFRWDRDSVGNIGNLYLETEGGRWGMMMESGSEMEPHAEFNELVRITGPNEFDASTGYTWYSDVDVNYLGGAKFSRIIDSGLPAGDSFAQYSLINSDGLSFLRNNTVSGETASDSTKMRAGELLLRGRDLGNRFAHLWLDGRGIRYEVYDTSGSVIGNPTILNGVGLTATDVTASVVTADSVIAHSYVTTPKWKVIPDYVFEKGYALKSLRETEQFVKANKHLPEVPSAKEMSEKGLDLTDMNMMLLKKVEELTLHMIEMDKQLQAQRSHNSRVEREMQTLRAGKGK